jgi:hypothetical protein
VVVLIDAGEQRAWVIKAGAVGAVVGEQNQLMVQVFFAGDVES